MVASKTQTQQQEVKPWKPYEPYYLENAADFKKLIDAGSPEFYQGSTVAGLSDATKQSQALATQYALGNNSNVLQNATNTANSIMTNGGQNSQANSTISQLMNGLGLGINPALAGINSQANNVANSAVPGQSTYNSVMNGGSNPAINNLNATASGQNIGKNPYLELMVNNQQNAIADKLKNTTLPGLQSQAAAMGRTGSAAFAHQINSANNVAANEMGKVAADLYGNQYNQDTQNMLAANQQVGALHNQDTANKLNAATSADSSFQNYNTLLSNLYGQQSNAYQQGVNNQFNNANLQMGAAQQASANAQNAANTQLNAANSAGQIYQNGLLPSQILGGVGAAQDLYNQELLNADIARWDYNQNKDLQNTANFQAFLNGQGLGTTSSQTKSSGSALGGIIQAGLGLASLCDTRTKKHTKYLYTNDNNIKIYEFEYIHKSGRYQGPMAQELAETHPDLVEKLPSGYLIVLDSSLVKQVA